MTDLSLPRILAISLTFLLAGLVKGVTGMGLPTVAMGLLGTLMPPVAAAALVVVPSFVTNAWQLLLGPGIRPLALRLWPMMLGILAGTLASSWLLTKGSAGWTVVGLGGALMAYAAFGLLAWQWTVPARLERRLAPAVGLATGAISGGTGIFVLPAVPYLQALGLDRDALVQALGLSFTVSTVALAIGLAWGGAFQPASIGMSTAALAPALLGMWLGQGVRRRIASATFRRCFLVGLLLLGLQLVLRPFF